MKILLNANDVHYDWDINSCPEHGTLVQINDKLYVKIEIEDGFELYLVDNQVNMDD